MLSAPGQLLNARAGQSVTTVEILAAVKTAFGDAAPAAIAVTCAGNGGAADISEIDIYLSGDVTGTVPLSALVHKADKAGTCSGGPLVMPAS